MSTSYWSDRSPKNKKKSFDVLIVGAGIAGLSTAYWLNKEDPSLTIAILEKNRLGSGATGRNAGFITCGSVEHFNRMVSKHGEQQALEIWKYAETNMDLLKTEIIQDSGKDLEFEQKGAYSLAAQQTEFEELKSVAKLMEKYKIPIEVCSQSQIQERLGAQNFVGGIRYCRDGAIHPVRLLERITKKTKFEFFEQTEVFSLEEHESGTRVLKTDNGDFEGSMVVYCTNGYSANLHNYFRDKIYPTRGQILLTEPVKPFMDGPCYANFYLDYFRQLPSGALRIGGFRPLEKETEVGYSDHITEVIQEALHSFIRNHLPKFKNSKITHRWAGVMGFSQDGEPLFGSLPTDPQVFFAGGFTGHGIGFAFHTAKSLVDLIYGRPIPDWLSAKRF